MNLTNPTPFKTTLSDFESQETFWINYVPTSSNIVIDLESLNYDKNKITDHILSEFQFTSEIQKVKFREMVIKWLSENDLNLNDKENLYELRDLIYEMF